MKLKLKRIIVLTIIVMLIYLGFPQTPAQGLASPFFSIVVTPNPMTPKSTSTVTITVGGTITFCDAIEQSFELRLITRGGVVLDTATVVPTGPTWLPFQVRTFMVIFTIGCDANCHIFGRLANTGKSSIQLGLQISNPWYDTPSLDFFIPKYFPVFPRATQGKVDCVGCTDGVKTGFIYPVDRYAYVFGYSFMPFPEDYVPDEHFTLCVGPMLFRATADSPYEIEKIGFSFDDGYIHWTAHSPYICMWVPPYGMGWHTVTLTAYDKAGNIATATMQVATIGFTPFWGYGYQYNPS